MRQRRVGDSTRLAGSLLLVGLGLYVAIGWVDAFYLTVIGEHGMVDFRSYLAAAEAVIRGESPYVALDDPAYVGVDLYVYPPLTALLLIPLTAIPAWLAHTVGMALLVAGVVATLWLLDVRDWRCYVVALAWPPVLNAAQVGNVTILLGLGAAFAWRFRDRRPGVELATGLTLATKLVLWPLVVWLLATRRILTAALACVLAAGALVVSWSAVGFDGALSYPRTLRRVEEGWADDGYSLYALGLDLGLAPGSARALDLALAAALLAGCVLLGRRGDDRGAFALAIVAALAFSPIVWSHYLELMLLVVAVLQPRLGVAWFVPLSMYLYSSGAGSASPRQTALTLAAMALTVLLGFRWRQDVRHEPVPGARAITASSSLR